METVINEIAPGLYRLSTYIAKIDLQFNQFLVKDDEPLLYHTGMRGMFEEVRRAVAEVLDPSTIRWIGFSHFEADECGALNEWLAQAPRAKPVCGTVGALVNVNDFIGGRAPVMGNGEVLATGLRRFRFLETPHVPHGWDASLLFEESGATLFCSDLFLQSGNLPPVTDSEIVEATRRTLRNYQAGPLRHSYVYSSLMERTLQMLAGLRPGLIATMHGSSFRGDGAAALITLDSMYREELVGEGGIRG